MHREGLIDIWNERARTIEVLEITESVRPAKLDTVRPPALPGVYLLTLTASRLHCYRRAVSTAWPVYIGSANNLRQRTRDHRLKFRQLRNVDCGSVEVVWVPAPSLASALYAEELLIQTFRPVWNERWLSGAGSKLQGRNRSGQRRTAFDVLHPRHADLGGDGLNRRRLELKDSVVDHLADFATSTRFCAPDPTSRTMNGAVVDLRLAAASSVRRT